MTLHADSGGRARTLHAAPCTPAVVTRERAGPLPEVRDEAAARRSPPRPAASTRTTATKASTTSITEGTSTTIGSPRGSRRGHEHHDAAATASMLATPGATQGHEHPARHAAAGGIEWEDDMVEVNKITTPANMRWKLVDRSTGAAERTRSIGSSPWATG